MALHESVFEVKFNNATMQDYEAIMEEAPRKFDAQSSSYRKASAVKGEPRCDQCMHFFQRVLDSYHVCEIVRPVPEQEIQPEWTCKFQTADGKKFPLYSR